MPDEIQLDDAPGLWAYAILERASDGEVRTGLAAFEAFDLAHWASYALQIPEQGGTDTSGRYRLDFPGEAQDTYRWVVRVAAVFGSPAPGDPIKGGDKIAWPGVALGQALPAAGFPGAADLAAYITSLGVIDAEDLTAQIAGMNLSQKASDAAAEFELRTGYRPFSPTVQTRFFDPPGRSPGYTGNGGRVLELEAGLISVTALTVGIVPGSAGTVLAENLNYRLGPYNAPQEGEPYQYVEFVYLSFPWTFGGGSFGMGGAPRSISIAGTWGYGDPVPADAWQAVLFKGAEACYPELALYISAGVEKQKSLHSETTFGGQGGAGPLSRERAEWERSFEKAVRRRRRVTM